LKPILVASAGLALYLVWRSLSWPLIHDAPLMHYVAWLITQGAVPYRDVFDMNLPGVYLVHVAVIKTLGEGSVAWRLFDLGWLAATAAALWGFCRRMGDDWSGLGAALLFILYHLAGGAWRAGQRDFLLALLLVLAAWGVARSWETGETLVPLAWGGLAAGAGIMIKPHVAAFWLACAPIVILGASRARRSAVAAVAVWTGAGLAVPVLVLGWLAMRGGLGAFADITTGYVLPLYSRVGGEPIWQVMRWHAYGWQIWICLVALALLGAAQRIPAPYGIRRALAVLGAVYGGWHFTSQGKGWEYHLYPLAVFLCVLGSMALAPASRATASRWNVAPGLSRAASLAVLVVVVAFLGLKGADAADAPWIAAKERRVSALVRDLEPLVGPGGTVQVMDVTEGGIHALLRLHLREPTRFLYDFHFFHDEGDPRIQALRAEFSRGLETRPPVAVVIFRDTWRRAGYARLEALPAVTRLLQTDYRLAVEGDGYRIYAQRSRS